MKTHALGTTGISVSSVVLGLMRIKTMSDAEIRTLYDTAREVGINMIDHADIYGGERHLCEQRFGEAVKLTPAERETLLIQSKTGIRKGFFDFSKEHILRSVDESLAALKTDYLDILLLHRPDALVEPEDWRMALEAAARHFGATHLLAIRGGALVAPAKLDRDQRWQAVAVEGRPLALSALKPAGTCTQYRRLAWCWKANWK